MARRCSPEIFTQNTIASSNYNSLQVSLEKRASKGLQFLIAYTFSKTIDDASTFEEVQNPLNPRANRSLSLFGAKQRLVFSYVWDLPVPKYAGGKGKVLNGWQLSGITSFQSGFPIRVLSNNDDELMNSFDFNLPGKPDLVAPFKTLNPRSNQAYYFDTSAFADPVIDPTTSTPLQLFGNAPRAICCGPGINNFDIACTRSPRSANGSPVSFGWSCSTPSITRSSRIRTATSAMAPTSGACCTPAIRVRFS